MKAPIGWLYADLAIVLFVIMLASGAGEAGALGLDAEGGSLGGELPPTDELDPVGPSRFEDCVVGLRPEPLNLELDLRALPLATLEADPDSSFVSSVAAQLGPQIGRLDSRVGLVQTFSRGDFDRIATSHWINLTLLSEYETHFGEFRQDDVRESYDGRMRRFLGSSGEPRSATVELFLFNECVES